MTTLKSKQRLFSLAASVGLIAACFLASYAAESAAGFDGIAEPTKAQYEQSTRQPLSVTPTLIPEQWWITSHDKLVKVAHTSHPDTVFFGDSITAFINPTVLHEVVGANAINMGIPGDQTQHLLWRLQNGELDFTAPKPRAIVLLIGTNNLSKWATVGATDVTTGKTHYKKVGVMACTNKEIFEGVQACVNEMKKHLPDTKILVVGILPRDEQPDAISRQRIKDTNVLLQSLADNKHVFYTDIGKSLLQPDGSIARDVMYDFLHPTKVVGYQHMLGAIKPHVDSMLSAGASQFSKGNGITQR
ncbi:MAG TPA: GDSL-type esterase/lipase family protein [Candidatus Obscuribacterales bacterium]